MGIIRCHRGGAIRTVRAMDATAPPPPPVRTLAPADHDDGVLDVVVVGGSVAGLSAALVLGRARWRVAVVDAGHPVNETVAHAHGYLTRDGAAPGEITGIGRDEVVGYGVDLVADEVVGVERRGDLFAVHRAGGAPLVARRLVLATGMRVPLPDLPGLSEVWGGDAATCPFCHGWEVRDQRLAVISESPMAAHGATLLAQWSGDVIAFVPPEIDLSDAEALGVVVDHRRPVALIVEDGRLRGITLDDGTTVARDALFLGIPPVPASPLAEALGCDLDDTGYPVVDPTGETSVPGVWAAGNAATWALQLIGAAASGSMAGAAVTGSLVRERAAALRG
jgi:thioredoxin reductase